MADYNGWKNYQTWNVALWANNEEWMYQSMVDYAKRAKRPFWMGWVKSAGLLGARTPDRCSYSGSRLDYKALNEMIRELKND